MDKSQSSAMPDSLSPRQVWIEVKRRKWQVAAILVLGMAAAATFTALSPVLYRSTASLIIENFVPSAQMLNNQFGEIGSSPEVIKANRLLAESDQVLDTARMNARTALKENADVEDVDFRATSDGQLLYLQVLDRDPKRAAVYANAWSEAFVEEMKKKAMEPVQLIFNQFNEIVPRLRTDYLEKLAKLQKYEEEKQFNAREYEANLDNQKLKRLDTDESKLRLELNHLKNQQTWLRSLGKITYEDLKIIADARTDPDLTLAKAEYERSRVALRAVSEKYRAGTREGDAELVPKQETLEAAGHDLEKAVQKFVSNFDKHIQNLEKSYQEVKKDLDEAMNNKQSLFAVSHKWNVLNTEAEQAKKLYDERFTQMDNTNLSSKTIFTYARGWDKAKEAKLPYLPNWRRNLIIGAFLSALAAVCWVIMLDRLDDTVRTPKDLQNKHGLVSMGIIPASDEVLTDEQAYTLVQHRGFSLISEALRNLHISLEVKHGTHRTGQPLTITVTSAMANEGKSLVSSNLALLFAGLGRKTLIVDADLRKRSLSKAHGCDDKPGLRDMLNGLPWSPALLVSPGTPGFFLLPAGYASTDSMDSIQPEGFSKALAEMRPGFDVIIFDTPPVLPMADACIMGQSSEVTLLVVRSRKTSLRQVEAAVSNLNDANIKEVMCVVNGVDNADASAGSYIYGYGYGYGYGREPENGSAGGRKSVASARPGQARGREKVRE